MNNLYAGRFSRESRGGRDSLDECGRQTFPPNPIANAQEPSPVEAPTARSMHKSNRVGIWRKIVAAMRSKWYLRHAHAVGMSTRVWGRPFIQVKGTLTVGKRVQFRSTIAKLEIVVGPAGRLSIGDDTSINYGTSISANHMIQIGTGCRLGMYVIMMDNDFHQLDPARRHIRPESAPIVLEDRVWLAARVIVLRGVTIGANSVIGAGSVVTRDIPPNVFAAGVPARVIKNLNF